MFPCGSSNFDTYTEKQRNIFFSNLSWMEHLADTFRAQHLVFISADSRYSLTTTPASDMLWFNCFLGKLLA